MSCMHSPTCPVCDGTIEERDRYRVALADIWDLVQTYTGPSWHQAIMEILRKANNTPEIKRSECERCCKHPGEHLPCCVHTSRQRSTSNE